MQFLLEASKESDRLADIDNYVLLSRDEKEKLVKSKLNNSNIDTDAFAYNIAKDENIYYKDHPLYFAAQIIPRKIGPISQFTLLQLGQKNNRYSNVIKEADWLGSADLYADEDANTAWKIKALTLASDNGVDLNKFKQDGHWLSIDRFKNVANSELSSYSKINNSKQNLYSRLKKLANDVDKSEKDIIPIVNEVDEKLEAAIQKAANELMTIRGVKIKKQDALDFVRTNLETNPDLSIDDLLLNYLRQL